MIIKQTNYYLGKGLELLLAAFMTIMIIAVVWQVFTRFVLQDPASFTDELSRYLLMWIGILGGAYTYSIKRHLALEILSTRLSQKGKDILSILIHLIILAFAAITMIYGGGEIVATTLKHGQISPGIMLFGENLKMGYVYLVVPLSGILISYYAVIEICQLAFSVITNNYNNEEQA